MQRKENQMKVDIYNILFIAGLLFLTMSAACSSQKSGGTVTGKFVLPKSIQGIREDTQFRDICIGNGHGWMSMRPMKNGKVTSQESCFGCMPNIRNHICEMKDYQNYVSQKDSKDSNDSLHEVSKDDIYVSESKSPSEEENNKIYPVSNNATISINATVTLKEISGKKYRTYAYNSQIPGPLLKVKQGSVIFVNFTNKLDVETSVHWHGLRLSNKYDGAPYVTQNPVMPGESFLYELRFPDAGIFWYHSHVREDAQQELGLYGNIFVIPKADDYFNRADREEFLMLDDILILGETIPPFRKSNVNHALMGRFGNIMLINGKTNYSLMAGKGDLARLYITNAANARTFNFSVEKTKLKITGTDIGKFEREFFSDGIVIAPGERYIAEAFFNESGTYTIYNKNPDKAYEIGKIIVSGNLSGDDSQAAYQKKLDEFLSLKENPDIKNEILNYGKYFDGKPDYRINLSINFPDLEGQHGAFNDYDNNIEWEDDMMDINMYADNGSLSWMLIDSETNKSGTQLMYSIKAGDVKKIRLLNDINSVHPMQHPIHLHGQRFLVLEQDGIRSDNLAWKDTVLVPKGSYADILVDFSNPGLWMMHCHIAEHLQSGMMAMFDVE